MKILKQYPRIWKGLIKQYQSTLGQRVQDFIMLAELQVLSCLSCLQFQTSLVYWCLISVEDFFVSSIYGVVGNIIMFSSWCFLFIHVKNTEPVLFTYTCTAFSAVSNTLHQTLKHGTREVSFKSMLKQILLPVLVNFSLDFVMKT